MVSRGKIGSMPEWLMGADCKSAGTAYAGSNPARPIPPPNLLVQITFIADLVQIKVQTARVAQW